MNHVRSFIEKKPTTPENSTSVHRQQRQADVKTFEIANVCHSQKFVDLWSFKRSRLAKNYYGDYIYILTITLHYIYIYCKKKKKIEKDKDIFLKII